jgi:hypothetical protein
MPSPLAHIAGVPVEETFAFLGPTAIVVLGVTVRERCGQLIRALRARAQKVTEAGAPRWTSFVAGCTIPYTRDLRSAEPVESSIKRRRHDSTR